MNAMTRDQEAIYDTRQARWQKAAACLGVCNLLVDILLLLRHVDNLATFRRSTQALVRIRRIYVSSNLVALRARHPCPGRPRDNNLLSATSIPGLTFLIYPVTASSDRSSHTMSSVYCALPRLPFRLFFYANISVAHSGLPFLVVISLVFHNTSCLS